MIKDGNQMWWAKIHPIHLQGTENMLIQASLPLLPKSAENMETDVNSCNFKWNKIWYFAMTDIFPIL